VPELRRLLRAHSFAFAALLTVALAIANVIVRPSFADPDNWDANLAVFAPLALVAMAMTPSILSGGGGLDISIGPLMNLVTIVFVTGLLGTSLGGPVVAVPLMLALGTAVGAINGVLIAVLRYQPVIATLCMLFVLGGVNLTLAPSPSQAPADNWTTHLAGSVGPAPGGLLTVGAVLAFWLALRRTAFHRALYAVGGDDAAAYSSGVDVTRVRVIAYAIGGLFAAVAGLALAGLVQSADPSYGVQYALIGLAAVALGGTPIGGGRGGVLGSLLGAASIYLIRNLLLFAQLSVVWLQVTYGALLIAGVVLSAVMTAPVRVRGAH
jgi:ribose transport system permease protein